MATRFSAGRSTKKALTTLEQLQKRRVGHGVHRKYNVLPLNTRVKIVGNARTDPAVVFAPSTVHRSSLCHLRVNFSACWLWSRPRR